jgi:hypothetical protein
VDVASAAAVLPGQPSVLPDVLGVTGSRRTSDRELVIFSVSRA